MRAFQAFLIFLQIVAVGFAGAAIIISIQKSTTELIPWVLSFIVAYLLLRDITRDW